MLKSRSSSSSSDKIFDGVRFVLFGFDSVSESQYRSEIVRRGGIDVGRYDDSCTHVIVSGRIYDDPVCVSARKDCKTLVTDLWIDDSVDFGTLADASRVLYRPVKDLNGIPGSESLYICLTGYQRPERDDIMGNFRQSHRSLFMARILLNIMVLIKKMVSLMGAKFSKPLIANQVTHLICYKFEGEKYELAKKVKIKLVNHRWLEDCLKAWDILPIDNYTKSGWELEVLEAEARDSEEETEDVGMELMGQRNTGGAPCEQGQMSVAASSHVHTPNKGSLSIRQEGSIANRSHSVIAHSHEHTPNRGSLNIQQEGSTANLPHSAENLPADQWLSTPYKETSFEEALSKQNLKSNVEIDHQEAGGVARKSDNNAMKDGELTVPVDVSLQKRDNITLSDVLTTKIGSVSSRQERSSMLCYSKRTPKKEIAREKPSDSCRTELNENILNGELDISPLEGRSRLDHFQFPTASCVLPQKRKVSDFSSIKSSELEVHDPKISPKSPTNTRFERLKPTSATSIHYGHADASSTLEGAAKTNSEVYQHGAPIKLTSLSYNKRSLKRGQPTSESKFSRNADSPSTGCTQNCQQGEAWDQPSGVKVKLAVETKELCPSISPSEDRVLEDMAPSFKPKNTMEADAGFGNVVSGVNNLASAGRNNDVNPIEEMASETSGGSRQSQEIGKSENDGDIVMRDDSTFMANETGVPLGRQHNGGAASPSSRKTRKLSRTASTGTCKENVNEESKIVHRKKVVSRRNLIWKPQLTTVNTLKGKDASTLGKDASTLDKATAPRKVESKPGKAEKSNSDIELGMEAVNDNKEATKSFSKDVVMEHQTKPKRDPLDQTEASVDLEKDNNPKENATLASNVNAHANSKVPCEDGRKSRQGTKRVRAKNCKKELVGQMEAAMDPEKENKPKENCTLASNVNSHGKVPCDDRNNSRQGTRRVGAKTNTDQTISCTRTVNPEPVWFILSGHRFQRKEFQAVIRRLRGKVCRDSHNWSYNATHFIVPEPVRRTEKFFAAAAAGRWILKMDYLTASNEAGKFVNEEPFEWYSNDLTEHGAISLEAPRKWRKLREKTGHGAFYGMCIIIYGDCISPTLDTLKRVVKAGDGTILATSPPYTRFLKSNVDFAIVSPGMPKVDSWVQEFLRHEIPCVAADYLVEYICKPGYPLKMHVLYNTHSWAEKSYANLLRRSEEIITDDCSPLEESVDDISCSVCGLNDRGEVMLMCGYEDGSVGCGIGTHIDCCNPPLEAVPEGDWFCTNCSKDREPKIPLRIKKTSSKCK